MKRIVCLCLAVLGTVALAFAQEKEAEPAKSKLLNVTLDTRYDFKSNLDDDHGFRVNNLKVIVDGEVVPGVRYRIRQRLNSRHGSPDQVSHRENYIKAMDHAYVEIDAGKSWTFRAGKQNLLFGTFEFDRRPFTIYLPSMNYDDLDSYTIGVNTAYKINKQIFNVQIGNSTYPNYADKEFAKRAFALNFRWEGDLFNGLINTRYGLGVFQYDKHTNLPWLTLGTRLNLPKFFAELDYYNGKKRADLFDKANPMLVKDQSLILNMAYSLGKFTPMLKAVVDKRQADAKSLITVGADNRSCKSIQAAVEYRPFEHENLKDLSFHMAYANKHFNTNQGNQHLFLFGIAWMVKVL